NSTKLPRAFTVFASLAIILALCIFLFKEIEQGKSLPNKETASVTVERIGKDKNPTDATTRAAPVGPLSIQPEPKPIVEGEKPEATQQTDLDIIQSPARPRGLGIRDTVRPAASDPASSAFANEALPIINDFLDGVFENRGIIDEYSPNLVLEDLVLPSDSKVRVYFINEGTVFHNSLGINAKDDPYLIFPNASSAHSYYQDAESRVTETSESLPLIPGDYVDLGNLNQGDLLDFFLIHDGARREESPIFWPESERNVDHTNHAKLHGVYDENTLIIGFEDIPGGGDLDFNDLVIAVEITPAE
ncbi:MAG: DUF4114 domain-containing protein, partial [Verrucomicrobiota bacterium]